MNDNQKTWVLITGASGGLGSEFAKQYAQMGCSLILVARNLTKMQSLAEQLNQDFGTQSIVEGVDLSDFAAIKDLHQRLTTQGVEVDTLINNAGYGLQSEFMESTIEQSLNMIQLDVSSLTLMTRLFGEDMKSRGHGKILLVSSLLAYYGVKNMAVYGAAKAFVLSLGDALHQELKPKGVTVTTLCPGITDTGFSKEADQEVTPALKLLMMTPEPVVRAGISALDKGKISVVAGFLNKAAVASIWSTPRWMHHAIFGQVMKG